MANTSIADLGPELILSPLALYNSDFALGNGSLKAGAIVSINETYGKVQGIDTDAATSNKLRGIGVLAPRVDTDIDTAIADGEACEVIYPTSGMILRVRITDPAATYYKDQPMGLSTTAGTLAVVADVSDLSNVVAFLSKGIASGDTVAEVRWR